MVETKIVIVYSIENLKLKSNFNHIFRTVCTFVIGALKNQLVEAFLINILTPIAKRYKLLGTKFSYAFEIVFYRNGESSLEKI